MPSTQIVEHSGLVARLLSLFLYLGSEWVMYLLLALSVVSIAIALERALFFFKHRAHMALLERELMHFVERGEIDKAIAFLRSDISLPARVATAGLESIALGPESVDELMSYKLMSERAYYERGLAFLGTLGNNAPFVGLFGTVLGIIRSFRDLSGNTSQGANLVMAGIAEALVATAVGLLVALPAVALFNAFQRALKSQSNRATTLSHIVLAHAKSQQK